MHLSTLADWLSRIGAVHAIEIDLGLDRVKRVADKLGVLTPPCPVIVVGGTNGKGSTVAGLEAIYRAAGYQVGAFTSPILIKHNEQVRINGNLASDDEFCAAFAKIETIRGDISLTPFEFHTLAALLIFQHYQLDVWLLEVGLGGRLDAVNIIDADAAVVTSIGIDHVEWLGDTRDKIAREKAGIFRSGKIAICGDANPPEALIESANQLGAALLCQGKDFHYEEQGAHWSWSYRTIRYDDLPLNQLALQNMSTVLMTITLMQPLLPVNLTAIQKGLSRATAPGRIQLVDGAIPRIYDVSHNPDSVALLGRWLREKPCSGKTHAVFSMLGDKDILQSINHIHSLIDHWYIAPLSVQRAAPIEMITSAFAKLQITDVEIFPTIRDAYTYATNKAQAGDRVVVFGSFHTVAEFIC